MLTLRTEPVRLIAAQLSLGFGQRPSKRLGDLLFRPRVHPHDPVRGELCTRLSYGTRDGGGRWLLKRFVARWRRLLIDTDFAGLNGRVLALGLR